LATVGEQRGELVVAIEGAEDISDVETERAIGERSLSHAAGLHWDQGVGLGMERHAGLLLPRSDPVLQAVPVAANSPTSPNEKRRWNSPPVSMLGLGLVLGLSLSRAMVRGSFPRAHTSLQNALKPHFVGTPSWRGLHRRASLSSRPLLPPRRPGRGGWRRWGPSPDRATTAAPGRGAKDRRSRSWVTAPYRAVKGFGFSDWWCAFSGRSRTDGPADIGGGWLLSGRHPKAGMMPVRSRPVPQCATAAKRLPHRKSRPGSVWNIPFRGDMQKPPSSDPGDQVFGLRQSSEQKVALSRAGHFPFNPAFIASSSAFHWLVGGFGGCGPGTLVARAAKRRRPGTRLVTRMLGLGLERIRGIVPGRFPIE